MTALSDEITLKLREILEIHSTIITTIAKKEDIIKDADIVIASYDDNQKAAIDLAMQKALLVMAAKCDELSLILKGFCKIGKD